MPLIVNVTLYGKRGFADVIKSRIWGRRVYSGVSGGGPKLSQGSSPEGDQGVKVTTVDDVMTEARGWNDMRKGREAQHGGGF